VLLDDLDVGLSVNAEESGHKKSLLSALFSEVLSP
jgi:hypothetical protein